MSKLTMVLLLVILLCGMFLCIRGYYGLALATIGMSIGIVLSELLGPVVKAWVEKRLKPRTR